MKKTYLKPSTLLTIVSVQKMICASPTVGIDRTGNVNAASVESRRGSDLWDDDEE